MFELKTPALEQKKLFQCKRASAISFLVLLVVITPTLTACRKRITNLTLKSPAIGERQITGKPSYTFAVPGEGRVTNRSLYDVYIANYDLDPSHFAISMRKPLTSDDQIRLEFLLGGGPGTNDKSPPAEGVYSADDLDDGTWVNVIIYSRKDGTENRMVLNKNSPLKGEIRMTSVSSDWVAAVVDLRSGETVIKGTFEAKILGGEK